jgi:hypothetical protein
MSLLLDKIIPLFVYPVGFAVAAGLLCLVFLAWGWRRAAATCIAVSTAYLWLAATPAVAALLARSLEAPYPQVAAESVEPADTIVVLGGMMNPPRAPPSIRTSKCRLTGWSTLHDFTGLADPAGSLSLAGGCSPVPRCPVKLNWSSSSCCFWGAR